MALVDIIMPQMGESIAEGTLSKWLKKVGDEVKRDEPIFEISTDKVDAEIPAPSAGVLTEIIVKEGETVAVQTVVARLETEKGAAVAASAAAAEPASTAAAPTPSAAPSGGPPPQRANLRRRWLPPRILLLHPQPATCAATGIRSRIASAPGRHRSFGKSLPSTGSTSPHFRARASPAA